MDNTERRIAELQYELGMLRAALEFLSNPTDQDRILTRINACVTEYIQLLDRRLSAVISVDKPLIKRRVGEADPA